MKTKFIIAIDGYSGAGKGTLAKMLANKLNILYVDTGAMYRAFGLYFIKNNIEINYENVVRNIDKIDINLIFIENENKVYLNGEDVTSEIRKNEVSLVASKVAKISEVRKKLVLMQQKYGENYSLVMEGRDITTVVFKNADLKIMLTADVNIRAERRKKQLEEKGQIVELQKIIDELNERDIQDTTRLDSPLKMTEETILMDSTNMNLEEEINFILDLLRKRDII